MSIIIYTDGSAKGNPGRGGYGVVMISGEHRKEINQGFRLTTNNRMELMAVIIALENIKNKDSNVIVYSDSKYVVDSVKNKWVFKWEKTNFNKTQVGIRPEFINFSNDGIKVKIKRVSDTGRHKVIDTECNSGSIKILASPSTQIPSGSVHITFDQKYTYAYGDNWIIE